MSCKNVCSVCERLILSKDVTFTPGTAGAPGTLAINLPTRNGGYRDGCKYCIVIADAIPVDTTINALVVITIGTGTQTYPLVKCNCAQVTACGLRTRTRYAVKVSTSATGGTFKLLGNTCCAPNNALNSINGGTPTTT